jgi:PadR family transcriptional regulator, regulatory protein PadR
MDKKIVRGVFLAFVRVHVLHHAAEGRIFGLEMTQELRHHGYTLSPGTLYPIFHSMEEAGYLRSADEVVNGKLRKYYETTAKGRRVLKQVKSKIQELSDEVIGD